jgi:hypothetical protein
MKSMYKVKILVALVGALFIIGAGCNGGNTVVAPNPPSTVDSGLKPAEEATLKGIWVCLPHQVMEGMETMECAYGIKADDGNHYALDFSAATLPSDLMSSIKINDRVTISGLVTPIEQISNNTQWSMYDVRGVIKVSSLEKK